MLCLQVARVKTFCGLIPRQLIFNNKPVFVATRLFLTIFLGLMLCGCIYGVPPNVHDLELENLDGSRIDNVVLTKRVVLERGTKIIAKYSSETTVDEISTSYFGTEHEIANVDCIVAGLRSALKDPTIISPVEFWGTVGADKDRINLTSLFNENYSNCSAGNTLLGHVLVDKTHQYNLCPN